MDYTGPDENNELIQAVLIGLAIMAVPLFAMQKAIATVSVFLLSWVLLPRHLDQTQMRSTLHVGTIADRLIKSAAFAPQNIPSRSTRTVFQPYAIAPSISV